MKHNIGNILSLLLLSAFLVYLESRILQAESSGTNVTSTSGKRLILESMKGHPNVAIVVECFTDLVRRAFQDPEMNYLVKYEGITPETSYILATIANRILANMQGTPVHVGRTGHFEQLYNLHMRFLLIDSMDALLNMTGNTQAIESVFVYYVIVYMPPDYAETDPMKLMESIFRRFLNLLFLNINIAIPFSGESIEFYTFMPYSPGDCDSTQPVRTLVYKMGDRMPALLDFFPPTKIFNFNGCALGLITMNIPPFIELNPNKKGVEAISGIEGEIVKVIAEKLNFTIIIIDASSRVHCEVAENGMSNDVFQALDKRLANFTIGDSSCDSERMSIFTATLSYIQSNIRIAIKTGEPYNSIEVLFYPFQEKNWVYWLLLFALRYAIIHFLYMYTNRLPRAFRQFILAMWLILIFFFRSAYEGSYFTYMHNRPLKTVPTYLEQLADEKYTLISDKTTYYLLKDNKELADIIVTRLINPDQTYEKVEESHGKYGALTKKEYIAHYLKNHPDKLPQFFMLHNNFITDILCMYFPRFSYLVESFDDTLVRLRSSGLITKYEKQFFDPRFLPATSNQKGHPTVSSENIRGLDISHLLGVFLLLFGLWLGAIFVFFLECLSLRKEILRRLFTYL